VKRAVTISEPLIAYFADLIDLKEELGDAVRLWNLETGELIRKVDVPNESWHSHITISPNGQRFSTVGKDGRAHLWSLETGEIVQSAPGFGEWLPSPPNVTFSPNGERFLTMHKDGKAHLWSVKTGQIVQTVRGLGGKVPSATWWSPNGERFLTVDRHGKAHLCCVETGQVVHTFKWNVSPWAHPVVKFVQDGTRFLTGCGIATKLWNAETGELLATLAAVPQDGKAEWACFAPQGYFVGTPKITQFLLCTIGDRFLPCSTYAELFHRPDLVRETLAGETESAAQR
jgi:WD40 repeat protein